LDEQHCPRAAFLGSFFWLLKRSNWFEGIQDKNVMDDGKRQRMHLIQGSETKSFKNHFI